LRTTEYTVFQAQNPCDERRKARRQDSPLEEVTKAGRAINASLWPGPGKPGATTARGTMKLAHALPWTCGGASQSCGAMTAGAAGGLGCSPVPGCVANTAQAFINY